MPEETGQEKTFAPTEHKLREAHERGEFARSREFSTVATFLVALLFFSMGQRFLLERLLESLRVFLNFDSFLELSAGTTPELFWQILLYGVPVLLPLLTLTFAASFVAELGQIGVQFRKDPFEVKWDRLNPTAGIRRIFSLRQFVEGLKSVIKLAIFAYVTYRTVRGAMPQIGQMTQNTPSQALEIMLSIGLKLGFRTCGLLLFYAGFDYWFQRWQYYRQLRMTHQEIRDEAKEREGDPVLKARIRSIQMEIARRRMMTAVPESDVVITNPSHYAVAIKYDPAKNSAPVVVAKGQNYLAQRIRDLAEAEKIPIVENPPIARMLYKKVPIGAAVPASLYKAVAEILASIWRLAQKRGRPWAAVKKAA